MSDKYNPTPEETMEFRLLYGGPLFSATSNDTRSKHKHDIRKIFHYQLKYLWNVAANLREWVNSDENGNIVKTSQLLASRFIFNGISFIPLSFNGLGIACKLDVLMLRPDQPGQTLMQSGDIDNRLKTLFDALRIPRDGEYCDPPENSENPFFCLFEDDSLVNHLSITTDLLLGASDVNEVRLLITVNIWPIVHLLSNMGIF
jgi:hypothetical protein